MWDFQEYYYRTMGPDPGEIGAWIWIWIQSEGVTKKIKFQHNEQASDSNLKE